MALALRIVGRRRSGWSRDSRRREWFSRDVAGSGHALSRRERVHVYSRDNHPGEPESHGDRPRPYRRTSHVAKEPPRCRKVVIHRKLCGRDRSHLRDVPATACVHKRSRHACARRARAEPTVRLLLPDGRWPRSCPVALVRRLAALFGVCLRALVAANRRLLEEVLWRVRELEVRPAVACEPPTRLP